MSLPLLSQNYVVSGYVKDAGSGEALIGATVVDAGNPTIGQASNVYGYYSFELPPGSYVLRASYVGYKTLDIPIDLTANEVINFNVLPEATNLDEVIVTAKRADQNVSSVEMSRENLSIEKIKSIPALFGEVDIIKSIQLLPGVTSAGEGTSGLFVRGGSSDQNLILLDEATVYNASHLLGFFSVFNPDAIKNVEIYKGGIPAKFGGRVSSILDIQMRDGNNKKFQASGGVGSISSRLTLEGPLVKDKSSFLISGRRTYADLFLGLSNDEAISNNTLYFYDLNAKLNYQLSDKDKLYVSGYFGRDKLGFQDLFGFDWGNATLSARWNHLFNEKLFMNVTTLFSDFNYGFDVATAGFEYEWNSGLREYNAKVDFDYFLNNNNTIKFGLNTIYHVFSPVDIESENEVLRNLSVSRDFAIENALYVSNTQEITSKLSAEYGVRYSSFTKIGADTITLYEEGLPFREENEVGQRVYNAGEIVKSYGGLEPRLGLRYLLNSRSSLKLSYNRMRQYLQVATNATAGFPTDRWIPADNYIKPVIADQIAAGYFKNINDNAWEISVETYYKWLQNIVDFLPGEDILLNNKIENAVASGKAWSYGAEFLIRRNIGKTTGWLGYTLARTQRQIEGVAGGNPYFARYDKTHDISLVVSHQLSNNLTLGANWVYATGAAVSFPEGRYVVNGQSVPYYNDAVRNTSRMPAFHRMDLSLNWDLKQVAQRYNHSLNFSFYNVYNRRNVFSIEFREVNNNKANYDEAIDGPITSTTPASIRTALFGIIPSITYNFKFN
jgi:hypothetical protein